MALLGQWIGFAKGTSETGVGQKFIGVLVLAEIGIVGHVAQGLKQLEYGSHQFCGFLEKVAVEFDEQVRTAFQDSAHALQHPQLSTLDIDLNQVRLYFHRQHGVEAIEDDTGADEVRRIFQKACLSLERTLGWTVIEFGIPRFLAQRDHEATRILQFVQGEQLAHHVKHRWKRLKSHDQSLRTHPLRRMQAQHSNVRSNIHKGLSGFQVLVQNCESFWLQAAIAQDGKVIPK